MTSTAATMGSIKEFTDRYNCKAIHNHLNPSEVELDSLFQQVKNTVTNRKVAVFLFVIGYFKAPCSLLLPFRDHNSGHYATFDLNKVKEWDNHCFYKVTIEQLNEEKLSLPVGFKIQPIA